MSEAESRAGGVTVSPARLPARVAVRGGVGFGLMRYFRNLMVYYF